MADMFGTSGKAGRSAAMFGAGMALQGQRDAIDYLTQGKNSALSALGSSRDTLKQASADTLGALGTGYTQARQDLAPVTGYFQPYMDAGSDATAMYRRSLGLEGADGNRIATEAFQAGPGYQWQRDQAADLAARKAGALGMAASGNTLAAITRLGSNLANQEYGNWQNRLSGLGQMGLSAAGGAAQNQARLADLVYGYGRDQGNSITGYANAANTGNMNEANIHMGVATSLADLATKTAGQVGQYGAGGLMAGQEAAQNRGRLAMEGVKLGASLLGSFAGMPGMGGSLGSLGGMFGGGPMNIKPSGMPTGAIY